MGGLLETGATARGEQAAQGGGTAAGVFGRHRGGAASDRMGVAAATADRWALLGAVVGGSGGEI